MDQLGSDISSCVRID